MAVAALSAVERIRKREEEKRIKCNKRKQEWYQRKKEMNAKNKETKPVSKEALWKRQQRSRQNEENEKRDEIRKQNNIRTKTFRERQKKVELELNGHLTNSFSNRTMKHRAVSKLIKSLPKSPQKRTEVVSAYLQRNSPTVKTLVKLKKLPSPELIENLRISDAVIKDVKSVINSVKHQRSDNARAAVSIICASINGNSVEKLRHTKKLADMCSFNSLLVNITFV